MIVLVPVSRFRVIYEVTEGAPYSQLERLVLRAVGQGLTSKNSLVSEFKIHPRLLIESLMTLTHAGWIALGGASDRQFVLTPEGNAALSQNEVPENVLVTSRRAFVLLERVTGSVIPEGEVRPVSKKVLKDKFIWDKCARLQDEVLDNRLDESQVHHLLPRALGQRLHWVGPIEMVSKGDHYIPVSVDVERGTTVNLPQRCVSRLETYVIERAREELASREAEDVISWDELTGKVKLGKGRRDAGELPSLPSRSWPVTWSEKSLLRTNDDHRGLLESALSEAETAVLISSRVAELSCLESLKPHILEALRRGADVDLLWGYENGREPMDWMKKLAFDTKSANEEGKFRFNKAPANCNAKMVLWDEGGRFNAAVGSYDWLAQGVKELNEEAVYLSVLVDHPAILSTLAWCAAGFWAGARTENLSSVPDRWRRIATKVEGDVCEVQGGTGIDSHSQTMMRVLLDRDHPILVREWAATAQARLIVSSESLGSAAKSRLASAQREGRAEGFLFRVTYRHTALDDEGVAGIRDWVKTAGGEMACASFMGANVVVSDNSACISGYSFLSRQFDETARELGIVIEGAEQAAQVAAIIGG